MDRTIRGARVWARGRFENLDITVRYGKIVQLDQRQSGAAKTEYSGLSILPGFADAHVHLRSPGFSYKETMASGTAAAARGGFTDVCAMPNLNPVPDSLPHLWPQLYEIARTACVNVHPYGAITVDEKGERLAEMEQTAPYVVAFSDDGRGVQSEELMREAMRRAARLHRIIAAHCEEPVPAGGCIHDGAYARAHGHIGIPSQTEWRQVARDLGLARETGCAYHVCHVSTKESVALIRAAKKQGLDVTCETAPHYLLLDESMLEEDGRFKMNPPIRERADREALVEGLLDGTIDMIATDHAPHTAEEKGRGLDGSLMGVVGLETAFPALYAGLVAPGVLPFEALMKLMCDNPAARFSLESGIAIGRDANFTAFDLDQVYAVDPEEFRSMGRATPFAGRTVRGRCLYTWVRGEEVWRDPSRAEDAES